MSMRDLFSTQRKIAEREDKAYQQRLLLWHESSEGKQVMRKLEEEFMPFALQHCYNLLTRREYCSTINSIRVYRKYYVSLETFSATLADEEAAGVVRKMRNAFTHVVGDFTLAGALAQIAEFERQINDELKYQQSIVRDAAYFHEVRAGSRRMELLAEAFRKNLDGDPIFVELAGATTPQELETLAERLAATPAITPLVAFDRALTS